MRIRRLLLLTAGFFLAACGMAGAQEAGKAGLTIAYPGSIGVIWHVSDRFAIRPAFSFSHSSTDGATATDGFGFGADISALFYLKKYDNVRTYISPRFSYDRSTSTLMSTATTQVVPGEIKSTTSATGGAGLFGVQYSPGSHFSVFGEVGIGFSQHKSKSSFTTLASNGNTWGSTAGIGLIFYP